MAAAVVLVTCPDDEILACEGVVVTFAVLYGFGLWPAQRTLVSIAAFALVAACVMYPRALSGQLPPGELVEVVAPLVLVGSVVYHARRREAAMHELATLAEADRRRASARDLLGRLTSHELRTPLTIASGYVDHLLVDEGIDERRADLLVVRDELDRITRVSDRLVQIGRAHV